MDPRPDPTTPGVAPPPGDPVLAFEPDSIERHRERVAAAITEVYHPDAVREGRCPRPSARRRHLFDFEDRADRNYEMVAGSEFERLSHFADHDFKPMLPLP